MCMLLTTLPVVSQCTVLNTETCLTMKFRFSSGLFYPYFITANLESILAHASSIIVVSFVICDMSVAHPNFITEPIGTCTRSPQHHPSCVRPQSIRV
jgi:hypothetical protein